MKHHYQPGDRVFVNFAGIEHNSGEVVATHQHSGYVLCRITIDPEADYGSIGPRLDPEPTVCVLETAIKPA